MQPPCSQAHVGPQLTTAPLPHLRPQQLDRWSGEGRPRVTLHLPRATGGASELARVKRVFVECLYRGAAAALAAASPNRIYGVLVMADYYEAPSVQQKAAARLHRAFTEGEDRLWRTVTPSGRGSAASGGGASQEDRALLRAARVALTPASQDQAVVARLRQGAASYLAAVACPGPLISAWQAAGGAARARVLAEPSTLVMSRLLRRDCAAATAAGHLAAAPAFSIAAEWCAAQPGGGGAAQRRALLEALPLGQLSLLFFTSVVMGSQLSSALKKWELQALLLHIQAAPVKVSALHAGWVAPPWAAEGGGRELRLAASARAIRTAAAALAALPAAGAAGKRCHTVVPEDPAAWEVFVGGHRFRLSLLVWQERASSAAPESWLALACKQLRPAFAFDGIAPAARCRLSVSTLEGDEATRLRTAEVAFVAGGAEQEVCCFRDKARDPNDLDYSDFESDGDGYIIWDRYRYRPLFEDDAGELCLSIKFKVVA